MFETFTEEIRKVMAIASQEAQKLNRGYIGTEHILLGLIKGDSKISDIVKSCGVDLKKIEGDLEKTVVDIERAVMPKDIMAQGKLPQTPRVKMAIEYAIGYARKLYSKSVGTEHLLYGLLKEDEGIAAQILMHNGLNEDKLTKALEGLVGVLDSSKRSGGLQAQNYWMIPRENMDITNFLQLSKYEVTGERNGKDNPLIKSLGFLIGRLNSPEYTSGTLIYNVKDGDQLKEALGLRDVFDFYKINYIEEPPASEVAKEMRELARIMDEGAKQRYSLVDELEKKVQD